MPRSAARTRHGTVPCGHILARAMDSFPLAARANRAFAEQDFSTAISLYTEALDEDEGNCTLLWCAYLFVTLDHRRLQLMLLLSSNRSAAHYKMELYKTSLKDADAAISIDPNCTKAWFRKGVYFFPSLL